MGGGTVPASDLDMKRRSSRSSTSRGVGAPHSIKADVPLANAGGIIPFILGRRRVSKPNVISYGTPKALTETVVTTETRTYQKSTNYGPVTEYEDVTETVTTKTEIPIGFLVDITIGICLGPGVVLRGLYADNVPIWQGSIGPARTTLVLPENETAFSGCEVAFSGGSFSQGVDPWVTTPDTPGYVGVAYMIFRSVRADLRIGSLSFEVERFPNPLGLTTNQNRKSDDINLATAMYEVLTSDWGGAGISTQFIGSSFSAAALQYASEEGYCSIVLDSETSAGAVLSELQKQSYSLVFPDPSTAKIEVKPIRQSTPNFGSALNLGRSNVLRLNEFKKNAWSDTLEVIQATFPNRADDYEPTPLIAQSIQNSQTRGSRRSASVSYPFACRTDIVAPSLSRLLSQNLVPTFTAVVLADRSAADSKPGDVALLSWPQYDIWSEPVLITKVRKHPMKENTVSLTVEQYRTPGMDDTLALQPDDPIPTTLGTRPVAPVDAAILTAPFFFVRAAGRIDLNTNTLKSYPMFLPIPANGLQFACDITVEDASASPVVASSVASNVLYATYGQLHAAIDKFDGWTTGNIGDVRLNGIINKSAIPPLASVIREGRFLLLIDEEIFAFDEVNDLGFDSIELTNVRRALIDTVPQNHAAGAHCFIINNTYVSVPTFGYDTPMSYTPTWRFISSTINEKGKPGNPATTLTKVGWSPKVRRSVAPPRPHDTKIEGVRRTTPIFLATNENYLVSWRSRSRTPTQLRFQTDAADPNEAYSGIFQKHRVYLRDSGNTLRFLGETADSADNINQLSVTIPDNVPAGDGTLFVRSFIANGESVYDDTVPVTVFKGQTFNFSYELEA